MKPDTISYVLKIGLLGCVKLRLNSFAFVFVLTSILFIHLYCFLSPIVPGNSFMHTCNAYEPFMIVSLLLRAGFQNSLL